jgi:peptidoglycan/xylan/chitin deacetylase (PgdA/CDA1 family)
MRFFVKTNWLIRLLFPKYTWKISNTEKVIFLTFDDGPTPEITQWVINELKKYNAKATFFCIGENIKKYPDIFLKITQEKHAIGNHTFNHLNGWKTDCEKYLENIELCTEVTSKHIPFTNKLFRPPYGKIKKKQAKQIISSGYKVIMWDVISYDFDNTISKDIESGSIIVFHDSKKAWVNLEYSLPKTLEYLHKNGFTCKSLS